MIGRCCSARIRSKCRVCRRSRLCRKRAGRGVSRRPFHTEGGHLPYRTGNPAHRDRRRRPRTPRRASSSSAGAGRLAPSRRAEAARLGRSSLARRWLRRRRAASAEWKRRSLCESWSPSRGVEVKIQGNALERRGDLGLRLGARRPPNESHAGVHEKASGEGRPTGIVPTTAPHRTGFVAGIAPPPLVQPACVKASPP
jgi:hypothetical protein